MGKSYEIKDSHGDEVFFGIHNNKSCRVVLTPARGRAEAVFVTAEQLRDLARFINEALGDEPETADPAPAVRETLRLDPPGFFVWNPSGSSPRCCHKTRAEAQAEAERLARVSPGERFYVLAPVEQYHSAPTPVIRREVKL